MCDPPQLPADAETATQNGHAVPGEVFDASEPRSETSVAAASEVEASADDAATAAQSSEDAPEAKHEEPESAKTDASGRPIPEQWKKRLWFVRMPKPAEDAGTGVLEQEIEGLRMQVQLLNESLAIKRMERDHAAELTQGAQETMSTLRETYDRKKSEAEPHRQQRKELKETAQRTADKFRSEYGELAVRSEEALDSALAAIEARLNHETNSVATEKKLIADLKKLESQREKVREYQGQSSGVKDAQAQAAAARASTADLDQEVQEAWEEMQTQRAIVDTYRTEENAVRSEMKKINDERARVKGLQDDTYMRMRMLKTDKYGKTKVWGENRRFSQQIRLVLGKSCGLAEARSLCAAQMEEAHALLADDEAFRAEYMRLWEAQRKHPISPYSDADFEDSSKVAKANGKSTVAAGNAAALNAADAAKKRAETLIAEAMSQAKTEVDEKQKRRSESESAAAAVKTAAKEAEAAENSEPVPFERPLLKVRKAKKPEPAAPPVLLPDLAAIGLKFELPATVTRREEAVVSSGDELKRQVRERNKEAAAEAERRKEQRRLTAEKRRQKAEQQLQQEKLATAAASAVAAHPPEKEASGGGAPPLETAATGRDAGAGGEAMVAPAAVTSPPVKAASVPKQRYALPKEPAKARIVAKRKTLWGRVKSGSQGVLPKETQRQLAGAIKERPWLAPAGLMASVTLIFALIWVFATYGI